MDQVAWRGGFRRDWNDKAKMFILDYVNQWVLMKILKQASDILSLKKMTVGFNKVNESKTFIIFLRNYF